MFTESVLTRRELLTGSDRQTHHISSAVVVVMPARGPEIRQKLAAMLGVEIHAAEASRIVVTIEGPDTGFLGEALTRMSLIDGVISANMVFEHIENSKDVSP